MFLDKIFGFIFKLYLGGEDMVALYVALIINGRRTFNQVPSKLREAVKADLYAMGLDENGDPIESQNSVD